MVYFVLLIFSAILMQNVDAGFENNTCEYCGKPSLYIQPSNTSNGEINGTNLISPKSYPWIIRIFIPKETEIRCAGGIISATFILTAAHCVLSSEEEDRDECYQAKIPELCFMKPSEFLLGLVEFAPANPRKLLVSKVIPHPDFDNMLFWNDVALIQLKEPLLCDQNAMPICLPWMDLNRMNDSVAVAGWGDDSETNSCIFREATLKQVSNHNCSTIVPNATEEHKVFCAVEVKEEHALCTGDSGSLLFTNHNGTSYALGVTSQHTSATCSYPKPIGFVRIFAYMDFIQKHVKDLPVDYDHLV